jgi:hypothetical protein
MQYVVAPCFYYAFERHDVDEVVGGPPDPEKDNPEVGVGWVFGQ